MSMLAVFSAGIVASRPLSENTRRTQGIQLRRRPILGPRLTDEAGGRRFIKGLTGRSKEIWRGVSEGLMMCREDIESGEARLAEEVGSFEQWVYAANGDAAAKKVRGDGREAYAARVVYSKVVLRITGEINPQAWFLSRVSFARTLFWWVASVLSQRASPRVFFTFLFGSLALGLRKVSLAEWDNATEVTKALEREEDADAARDELRTAMGAIIPRGLLESASQPGKGGVNSSTGPSRRPTLVLLGLNLPAAVRDEIRADLDREAPSIFGLHITGVDTLPSLAAAVRTRDRGFLDPCRQGAPTLPLRPQGATPIHGREQEHLPSGSEIPGEGGRSHYEHPGGDYGRVHGQTKMENTRTGRLQAALSAGRSASLEVVPGPGLWARGRFLRDLEALLRGLDDCGDCSESSVDGSRRGGFTVVLMEGHDRNRSGGGANIKYGTKYATTSNVSGADDWKAESPARHGLGDGSPLAMVTARRTKVLLEQAAQCLHDLSTTHGDTPSPLMATAAANNNSSPLGTTTPTGDEQRRGLDCAGPAHVVGSLDGAESGEKQQVDSLKAKCSSPGLDLLLAACHMITHPDRQYDLRECRKGHKRGRNSPENTTKLLTQEWPRFDDAAEENAALTVASCLARQCRHKLAELRSAREVASFLRQVDLTSVPFGTAVSIRLLLRHPAWPTASARLSAGGCFASEAFCGWIVAAVTAATEIALTGGGSSQPSDSDLSRKHIGGMDKTVTKPGHTGQAPGGGRGLMKVGSTTRAGGSRELPSLEDIHHEREREREVLQELETSMVDEIITIVDDDLTQLLRRQGADIWTGGRRRRQCRSVEAFNALMETVLRPFQVSCIACRRETISNVKSTLLDARDTCAHPWVAPCDPGRIRSMLAFGFVTFQVVLMHS